jgi:hypothetical protein
MVRFYKDATTTPNSFGDSECYNRAALDSTRAFIDVAGE